MTYKGYIYALISSVLVSTNFLIVKLLLSELDFANVMLYVFSVGTIMSLLLIIFKYKKLPIDELLKHKKQLFLSGFFISIASIAWSYSLDLLGPASTSFIAKLNIPFTIFLGVIFLRERLNKFEMLGFFVTIFGVIILSYSKDVEIILASLVTVLQAAAFSLHNFFVKKIVNKTDILIIILARTFIANIFILFFVMLTKGVIIYSGLEFKWYFLLILSPFTGLIINNYFRYKSLQFIDLSKNALMTSFDPLIVSILSIIILSQHLTLIKYLGGITIIFGVVITLKFRNSKTNHASGK